MLTNHFAGTVHMNAFCHFPTMKGAKGVLARLNWLLWLKFETFACVSTQCDEDCSYFPVVSSWVSHFTPNNSTLSTQEKMDSDARTVKVNLSECWPEALFWGGGGGGCCLPKILSSGVVIGNFYLFHWSQIIAKLHKELKCFLKPRV